MKYLLLGLFIGGLFSILVWLAEENINNARCYKTNHDLTTICVYSDGHSEIYREEVK